MRGSSILIGATLGALSIAAMGAFVGATVSAVSIVMTGTVSLVQHDPTPIMSAGSPRTTDVAYGGAPFRVVDSASRSVAAAARGAGVR
jgi:hypothetical protein